MVVHAAQLQTQVAELTLLAGILSPQHHACMSKSVHAQAHVCNMWKSYCQLGVGHLDGLGARSACLGVLAVVALQQTGSDCRGNGEVAIISNQAEALDLCDQGVVKSCQELSI